MTTQADVVRVATDSPHLTNEQIAAVLGCNPGFVSKTAAIHKLKLKKGSPHGKSSP